MKQTIFLTIAVFFFHLKVSGQEINKLIKIKSDSIEKTISDLMKYQGIPGLSVAVVKNNEIVYAKCFGVKNIETSEPLNVNTIFHMASISKTFVSSAIMKLVTEKKIGLDDSITKYLTNSTVADTVFSKIKIRHLLNHTSGVMSIDDHHWDKPEFDNKSLERYVSSRKIKLKSQPGEKFRYSDIGYEILGYVIEKASGMAFEEYLQKEFFSPLKMNRTTFLKTNFADGEYASPHVFDYDSCKVKKSNIYPYSRKHAPSSTLQSTILDMSKYAMFHLNNGSVKKKEILNKNSYAILWDTLAYANWSELYKYYGAGWFIGEHNGKKIIHHSGNDNGFKANFLLIPEENMAIVISSNYYNARVLDLGTTIIDMMIQDNWKAQVLTDDINEFVGDYCKDLLCVKVYKEDNKLYIFNKGEVDCLTPSSYKEILIGKYLQGSHNIPYYDNSNIWLQAEKKDGKSIYKIKISELEYIKATD